MTVTEFWDTYAAGMPPVDFVWQYGQGDPCLAVQEYLRHRPAFYGIIRRDSWETTFDAAMQYDREQVAAALLTHLEITRDAWEDGVQKCREADAREKAAEKARREAEALAAAVARIEAEALARIQAEKMEMTESTMASCTDTPAVEALPALGHEENTGADADVTTPSPTGNNTLISPPSSDVPSEDTPYGTIPPEH